MIVRAQRGAQAVPQASLRDRRRSAGRDGRDHGGDPRDAGAAADAREGRAGGAVRAAAAGAVAADVALGAHATAAQLPAAVPIHAAAGRRARPRDGGAAGAAGAERGGRERGGGGQPE
eukprot:5804652-Prymnesium_polylepis.1